MTILEMVSSVQLGGSRHAQSGVGLSGGSVMLSGAQSGSVGLSHAQLGSVRLSRAQWGSVGLSHAQLGSVGFSRAQSCSVGLSQAQSGSVGLSWVQSGSVMLSGAQSCSVGLSHAQSGLGGSRECFRAQAWFLSPQGHLPSLDGAIALSSHSRLVEVTELKEFRERLSEPWTELGRRSSKSSRY